MPSSLRRGWERAIVAAPGPTLTVEVAETIQRRAADGWRVVAVCGAWRRVPFADVLYAADWDWWNHFALDISLNYSGECWSATSKDGRVDDDKEGRQLDFVELNLVPGVLGSQFLLGGEAICYGDNSGFAAVNLALQFGATEVRMAGFDMTGEHFFGPNPPEVAKGFERETFLAAFEAGARTLPAGRRVLLCTPGSLLRGLEVGEL